MHNLFNKNHAGADTTLKPTSVIGIRSDMNLRLQMSGLLCVFVTVAMLCITKLEIDSFLLLGIKSCEPIEYYYAQGEITRFYILLAVGCMVICVVNALHKHSIKAIFALLALYFFWFGRHYKLVLNGFVRAANKTVFAVMLEKGETPTQYYLPFFDGADEKKELYYFIYAAAFALCFLLAYIGVRRCSGFWFAVVSVAAAAVPMAFNCLDSEHLFIVLAVISAMLYMIGVQGYRRTSNKNAVTNVGSTLKINGKYAADSAFQQTIYMLVCTLAIVFVINIAFDFSDYERPEKVKQLGDDMIYSAETLASGTPLDAFGLGSNSSFNNGRLSNLSDLDYTGRVMFEVKSTRAMPLYLRAYTAGVYTGKRWAPISGGTYRSYSFWSGFKKDDFYPQFIYTPLYSTIGTDDSAAVTIRSKSVNHKLFLTDYRMLPDESLQSVEKASYKYDGTLTFDRFGGESIYSQKLLPSDELYHSLPYFGTTDSVYNILHDGSFEQSFTALAALGSYYDAESDDSSAFLKNEEDYRRFVLENYTDYPDNIAEYLPADFDETVAGFYAAANYAEGTFDVDTYYSLVMDYVSEYLRESADYTLTPGGTPSGRDFVEYFINENHRGYCVHFATAASLLLRRAGIPTRYCEGYYVSDGDIAAAKSGYAPIPDAAGHAWCEVYYPLMGWKAVEFTPYYSDGDVPYENMLGRLTPPESTDSDEPESDSDTESESDTESDTENNSESESDTESDTDSTSSTAPSPEEPMGGTGTTAAENRVLKAILKILRVLLIIALIIGAWALVRFSVVKIRAMRFESNDTRKAALAMYFYATRILKLMNITPKNGEGEEKFAMRAAKLTGGKNPKELKTFTKTALSARFGKDAPSKEQIRAMRRYLRQLSEKLYEDKPTWKKLIIKYVLFFD